MAYPTPPTLDPIAGTATPNLTIGGPYDEVLNKIEAYFAQLGAYVDAQIAAVRGEIPSTTDFATAEQLEAVKQNASDAASAAATAQETAEAAQSAATAAQGAASTAQSAADEASASVTTLEGNVSGISTKVENMLALSCNIPYKINDSGDGLIYISVNVFNPIDGLSGDALQGICDVIGNFALAVPNGDQSKLFGYLGNKEELTQPPSVQPSAALTAAYEAGGITKSPDDPALTANNLADMKVSVEGVPYTKEIE